MKNLELGLTFDDVLLLPQRSDVLPRDACLATRLTDELSLPFPILSAAMDTVTEARLAEALARLGGMGVIHKNMSADAQAAQVAKVKSSESVSPQSAIDGQERLLVGQDQHLAQELEQSSDPIVVWIEQRGAGIDGRTGNRQCPHNGSWGHGRPQNP